MVVAPLQSRHLGGLGRKFSGYPQLLGKFEINNLDDERRTILEFSNDV